MWAMLKRIRPSGLPIEIGWRVLAAGATVTVSGAT